jgi:hypothetical protein
MGAYGPSPLRNLFLVQQDIGPAEVGEDTDGAAALIYSGGTP